MIQRIQSIFLFLAALAGFGVLGFPFATSPSATEVHSLFADAKFDVSDNIALLLLFGLAGALALGSIFLFKNRPLQMRLTQLSIVAGVIGLVLAVILFWQDKNSPPAEMINDGMSAYLPFGLLLFGILALRSIGKDEKLVKSMDRLR